MDANASNMSYWRHMMRMRRNSLPSMADVVSARQIKMALGISGVLTKVYAWRHVPDEVYTTGVQIDLLIERADRVVNVCEVKYSSHPFVIDKNYDRQLRSKAGTFADVTKTRSAVHLTMITSNGLSHTGYWGSVQSEVTLDDLFCA